MLSTLMILLHSKCVQIKATGVLSGAMSFSHHWLYLLKSQGILMQGYKNRHYKQVYHCFLSIQLPEKEKKTSWQCPSNEGCHRKQYIKLTFYSVVTRVAIGYFHLYKSLFWVHKPFNLFHHIFRDLYLWHVFCQTFPCGILT